MGVGNSVPNLHSNEHWAQVAPFLNLKLVHGKWIHPGETIIERKKKHFSDWINGSGAGVWSKCNRKWIPADQGKAIRKRKSQKINQSIDQWNKHNDTRERKREREKERKKEREIEGKKRKEIQFQIVMETAYKYVAYTFDPAKSTSKSTVTSIASSLSFFLLFFSLSLLSSFLSCLYLFHCIFALLSSSFFFSS